MTLNMFKDSLDSLGIWLKEMARRKHFSLEHLKGVLDGAYRILLDFLPEADNFPEIVNVENSEEKDLIGYVTVFDNSYPIYLDDYGQSFYTKIDNEEYWFGTYTTDIIPELIPLLIAKMTKNIFKEVEEIYNGTM